MDADHFIESVIHWGTTRSEVLALALVGSYARGTASASSDVDLVVVAEDPTDFIVDKDWIHNFSEVQDDQVEDYGLVKSVRVWYDDGLEVEFGITGLSWVEEPLDDGTRSVIEGGIVILFERDDLLTSRLGDLIP